MKKRPARFLSVMSAAALALNGVMAVSAENTGIKSPEGASPVLVFDSSEKSALIWATQIGEDKLTWSDAPTGFNAAHPDYIYICTANKICKVSKATGEVLTTAKMAGQATYATKGPAYSDGKVFMALDNGTVQAFDSETLESLWIYHNKNGGSPTCDIVCLDGKVFTGFWNGEEVDADYVCLDPTDLDEAVTDEETSADWELTNCGGYYWTTVAALDDDTLAIGCENGITGQLGSPERNEIYFVNRHTGEYITRFGLGSDDIRSKLVLNGDRVYYTDKAGHIISTNTEEGNAYDVAKVLGLEGYTCTSTPIVAGDRVYITLNAPGWNNYNGSLIVVLYKYYYSDGSFDFRIAYTLETAAACQAEGAFVGVDSEGYNVIYYVENGENGNIRILRDKDGMTEPLAVSEETDDEGNVHKCAPIAFKPTAEFAQYCSVDPYYDAERNCIYVRNDSFNLMCISAAATGLTFAADDSTRYIHPFGHDENDPVIVFRAGESPKAEGFGVELEGLLVPDTDVPAEFSVDEFTTDDEVLTVSSRYGLFKGDGSKAEVSRDYDVLVCSNDDEYARATAMRGDINGDGEINVTDVMLAAAHVKSIKAIDKYSINAADTDVNGEVNVTDLMSIAAHVKSIKALPETK
ncbi:PQQ-binding-like beta-propeller repeat protein [Ruminococcus sp.]|uniref:outer membrane protein assembly factor BamB family protein n=1 Tax=Ruminococcus sp. TaxID=41978 RepID=UPI0025EA03E4|nr:PQQ-binding-like beta-propeller repeat protein [Ruminococcus sp.]MBQ8965573.1 PQQ-binding-like beta-propeller repeat protein [Ruminococcus sp.]